MKIRPKNVKPKLQKTVDFAKKKSKVGRKVKRENVTQIKINSKSIHIPLQNEITTDSAKDDKDILNQILHQLHHYSSTNKIMALHDLRMFMNSKVGAESYTSLVLPEAMELLFDDDREIRAALLQLLSIVIKLFQPQSLIAVLSVTMTYICSGITSLNKVNFFYCL
jgi:hypothetical protein